MEEEQAGLPRSPQASVSMVTPAPWCVVRSGATARASVNQAGAGGLSPAKATSGAGIGSLAMRKSRWMRRAEAFTPLPPLAIGRTAGARVDCCRQPAFFRWPNMTLRASSSICALKVKRSFSATARAAAGRAETASHRRLTFG